MGRGKGVKERKRVSDSKCDRKTKSRKGQVEVRDWMGGLAWPGLGDGREGRGNTGADGANTGGEAQRQTKTRRHQAWQPRAGRSLHTT